MHEQVEAQLSQQNQQTEVHHPGQRLVIRIFFCIGLFSASSRLDSTLSSVLPLDFLQSQPQCSTEQQQLDAHLDQPCK